ncbi:unnamed protein product [Durusdinium trenchii]|uniref:Uncharacterized protein n=1 Tax=Durusdinium trenchii TaxID=1381693 RepID=A0ABP0S7Y4_9DINO
MIASLSRQLQGARLDSRTRIASSSSRSLQRDSHAGFDDRLVTLTQRPMTRHALGASAVGFWLLIPLSCMLVDRRFQVSLMLILWSMMAFCLILCGSAKCSSPEHMQGERKRPPRLSEVWPGTYQETKMLLFLLGICSSLACVISLTKGGALMLSLLRSPSQDGCSVAELKGFFSRGLSAFRCEDGNLDSKHEGTVLLRCLAFLELLTFSSIPDVQTLTWLELRCCPGLPHGTSVSSGSFPGYLFTCGLGCRQGWALGKQ